MRSARARKGFVGWRWIAGAVACSAAIAFSPARAETIEIGGTGMLLPVMRLMARHYERTAPDDNVVVLPSLGSTGGVKALAGRAISLAVTALPSKRLVPASDLLDTEFARTPLVMASSKTGAPGHLSLNALARIFTGETAAWPDGSPLRLIIRRPRDTSILLLAAASPAMRRSVKMAHERAGLKIAKDDQDNAGTMEVVAGSLGIITLGQVLAERRRLRVIAIGPADATPKGVADGSYPYRIRQFLVTRPERLSPGVGLFIDFVFSPAGREILSRNGYLPVPRKAGGVR